VREKLKKRILMWEKYVLLTHFSTPPSLYPHFTQKLLPQQEKQEVFL
jgi:hypothetical protein